MLKRSIPYLSLIFGAWIVPMIAQDEAVPAELLKLRASYDAEIKRLTETPKRKYVEALERLQAFYTKNGELDKALIVREEIQTAAQDPAEAKKMAANSKLLDGSEWQWGSGGTLKLERNGDAIHTAWATPGQWKKINSVTITIQRPGGDPPMTVVFSDQNLTDAVVTSHLNTTTTIKRIFK